MSEELTFERAGEDLARILMERATLRLENAELGAQLAAAVNERDEAMAAIAAAQKVMAEFKHIYPDGFPGHFEVKPEHLASQVTYLCNIQRCTFENVVKACDEITTLRARVETAKSTPI